MSKLSDIRAIIRSKKIKSRIGEYNRGIDQAKFNLVLDVVESYDNRLLLLREKMYELLVDCEFDKGSTSIVEAGTNKTYFTFNLASNGNEMYVISHNNFEKYFTEKDHPDGLYNLNDYNNSIRDVMLDLYGIDITVMETNFNTVVGKFATNGHFLNF